MDHSAVLQALRKYFGHTGLRPGQGELIEAILSGRDVLGVMPTGAGKSVCYQLPALLLPGITLVVSPLISLMKDQVSALREAGIDAAFINSSLTAAQQREALRRAETGEFKLIYVAPERLLTEGFLHFAAGQTISLLAVDEAHCVSQWGQDFRPSYLDIPAFVRELPRRPILAAFTATATEEVREDIVHLLELAAPHAVTTGFDRPNLYFDVRRESDKLAWLTDYLSQRRSQSGIVYCATRKTVEQVCQALLDAGFAATRYHAGLDDEERRSNQEAFAFDRATVMAATNAFGMGIDKSNVSFVIHYNMPKNIESYYQEAGRAGRDGAPADCVLLYSPGDVVTARYLITNAKDREGVPEEQRELLVLRDWKRLRQMTDYCKTGGCYRAALLDYFGEAHGLSCGNCGSCAPREENDDAGTVEEDITVPAQMVLSCVRRVERKNRVGLGEMTLVRVLAGSREKLILEREYDLLSTYGLMRDTDRSLIREYVRELLRQGYLTKPPGDYDVIVTTQRADAVLFSGERVTWRRRHAQKAPKAARSRTAGTASPELFERLRALRAELARLAQVPSYVIFSDATLLEMAEKQPVSAEEMLDVSGIGDRKAEKYGQAFADAIRGWRQERGLPPKNTAAYPENLLARLFDEPVRFPEDVAERLSKAIDALYAKKERDGRILRARYEECRTLESIGAEHGVCRERVRQLLEKGLRRLRRQNVREYLLGEAEQLLKSTPAKPPAETPPLRLRPAQLARFTCAPEGISITSFARRLTELRDDGQEGTLTGRQLSNWLLAQGLLTEARSDSDNLLRRPTPAGEAVGIRLEERVNAKGERFTMVVLTEQAQTRLLSRLPEMTDPTPASE